MQHGAMAQGLSGKWWCTDCITSADTIEQLRQISCRVEYMED